MFRTSHSLANTFAVGDLALLNIGDHVWRLVIALLVGMFLGVVLADLVRRRTALSARLPGDRSHSAVVSSAAQVSEIHARYVVVDRSGRYSMERFFDLLRRGDQEAIAVLAPESYPAAVLHLLQRDPEADVLPLPDDEPIAPVRSGFVYIIESPMFGVILIDADPNITIPDNIRSAGMRVLGGKVRRDVADVVIRACAGLGVGRHEDPDGDVDLVDLGDAKVESPRP